MQEQSEKTLARRWAEQQYGEALTWAAHEHFIHTPPQSTSLDYVRSDVILADYPLPSTLRCTRCTTASGVEAFSEEPVCPVCGAVGVDNFEAVG
jgi:hypothetical protein